MEAAERSRRIPPPHLNPEVLALRRASGKPPQGKRIGSHLRNKKDCKGVQKAA